MFSFLLSVAESNGDSFNHRLQEHLFELEAEKVPSDSEETKPIYVLYPDETANNWRIQAVPISPGSFESRKALPEVWRGLRDENLSQVSGVEGGIFVHASGFIGGENLSLALYIFQVIDFLCPQQGNKTKQGALLMAKKALEM
jgi:uncharacterized UPF0160 family protein